MWRLSDLQGTNLSLFLFGKAHEELWKDQFEGAVVAVWGPQVGTQATPILSCAGAASSGVVGRNFCQTGLLTAWPSTYLSDRPGLAPFNLSARLGHEHTTLTEVCGSVRP